MNYSPDIQWLPDWKDENQYPSESFRSSGEYAFAWAWEYLRRNPSYQELYDDKIGKTPKLSDERKRKDYLNKLKNEPVINLFSSKFGIQAPMDYRKKTPPVFTIPEIIYDPFFNSIKKEVCISQGEVLVRLDLCTSIGPQLKALNKKLTDMQKKGKKEDLISEHRNRDSLYHIRFLRLLDAELNGASIEDIYEQIIARYSNSYKTPKEGVEKNLEPAKEFVDGGYRIIAAQACHVILPYDKEEGMGSFNQKSFKHK